MNDDMGPVVKPLKWIGSSKAELTYFPQPVRKEIGYALHLAQTGQKGLNTKPLKGFGSAGVLEVVENHDGNAYRAVYTVKFAVVVFVLHVFQKKSKKGVATSKGDIDLVKQRLRIAAGQYERLYGRSRS